MRAVWKGTIGFGDYAIPVRVYSATEENTVGLNQVHAVDGGRIRYRRVCELDGEDVPAEEIVRGHPMPGGDVVMLTDADLARLPLRTAQSIDVLSFTSPEAIDPVYFAKSYFLEPEPAGTKPYVLFSEALQQSGRVAVVKVALRRRETLGALRVRDQVVMLETMLWPDEVRVPDFPFQHEDVEVRSSEVATAVSLIDRLAGEFEPGRYRDGYRAALEELIRSKVDGDEIVQPTATRQDAGVAELLRALRHSVERLEGGEPDSPVTKARAAAEKAGAAKARARRAATRSRTAKTRR